jgi:hypothetical protein
VEFEPTIPASERAKTVHALDRSATVIGGSSIIIIIIIIIIRRRRRRNISWKFPNFGRGEFK